MKKFILILILGLGLNIFVATSLGGGIVDCNSFHRLCIEPFTGGWPLGFTQEEWGHNWYWPAFIVDWIFWSLVIYGIMKLVSLFGRQRGKKGKVDFK